MKGENTGGGASAPEDRAEGLFPVPDSEALGKNTAKKGESAKRSDMEIVERIEELLETRGKARAKAIGNRIVLEDTSYFIKVPTDWINPAMSKVCEELEKAGYDTKADEENKVWEFNNKNLRIFALILGSADGAIEIKPRLRELKDLEKEGFEIEKDRSSFIFSSILFKGHYCLRIFFSLGKFGWYNLSYDRAETPFQFLTRDNKRRLYISTW